MDRASLGPTTVHASAITFGSAGLLVIGKAGSGKSTLALQLVGIGATLVADDAVIATPKDGALWLTAPLQTKHRIEARGFGILVSPAGSAWARAVVNLDRSETERLPPARETVIAGVPLPMFSKVESPAFATMLKLYLEGEIGENGIGRS